MVTPWWIEDIYVYASVVVVVNVLQVEEYMEQLEEIMIKRDDGLRIMPELYAVPPDKVEQEYNMPKSQDRSMMGKIPQMWGQSLYVLGKLVKEVCIGSLKTPVYPKLMY